MELELTSLLYVLSGAAVGLAIGMTGVGGGAANDAPTTVI